MRFEWDSDKDRANRAKHGVGFDTARLVFNDLRALSVQDRCEGGEERWQTLGRVGPTVVLLVAHSYRDADGPDEVVRIISARKATSNERRRYDQDDR
jgi:uncharacterized DUF497 family protein